jgi:hypothetical protein
MWRVLAHMVALSEDRRSCNSSGTGMRKILRAFPQGLKPIDSAGFMWELKPRPPRLKPFASGLKIPHRLRELSGARQHNVCRRSGVGGPRHSQDSAGRTLRRFYSDQPDVAFDRFDHGVHLPGQHLFGEAKREALGRMERNMRRQG